MAIIQAGRTFSSNDLKFHAGQLAIALKTILQAGEDFGIQLASYTDADLIALGLIQGEIDAIKGFFLGDSPAIKTTFLSSTWVKRLMGIGV